MSRETIDKSTERLFFHVNHTGVGVFTWEKWDDTSCMDIEFQHDLITIMGCFSAEDEQREDD